MKIIYRLGLLPAFFICVGFTHNEIEYQVIPLNTVTIEQKFHPTSPKVGTFLYTEAKQFKDAFADMSSADIARFDFENNRYVHIQYAAQNGCKENVEVIQEVRKYKHYYEVILIPYNNGTCKTIVKPYQVTTVPNDGLPVLITGTLPE